MATIHPRRNRVLAATTTILAAGALTLAAQQPAAFGPSNPFYAPSSLPFEAPPFDKIKDTDYKPAI
jgi:peptidyl-dipeptidase Dcp